MKKIVSVFVLGAVAASIATAEVTVGINSRTRPSLYTSTETFADKSKKSTILDFSNAEHSDDFAFAAKGENCGIAATLKLSNGQDTYTTTGVETPNGKTGATQAVSLSGKYYGWMNFGALKITAGRVDSRHVERHSLSTIDDGLADSDTAKFGVSNAIVTGFDTDKTTKAVTGLETIGKTFLYDFSNVSAIGGTRVNSVFVDYTIDEIGAGKLLVKGGVLANNYTTQSSDDWNTKEQSKVGAGFAADVGYLSDTIDADVVFKMPSQHAFGFGLYGDVKAVENLKLAAGFTYGASSEYDTYTYDKDTTPKITTGKELKYNAMAFDLRAFYQINEQFLAGVQAKYSSLKVDSKDANTSLELVASAQYTISELLAAQFDIGYYNEDMGDAVKVDNKGNWGETTLKVRPGVKVNASKNAYISAAFEFTTALNGSDAKDAKAGITKQSIALPVVFRVKL
ncbi:MAG: hypothetical protein IJP90_03855 [Treponema sp.]|nr:hypothetical protein [Treponema sp.]